MAIGKRTAQKLPSNKGQPNARVASRTVQQHHFAFSTRCGLSSSNRLLPLQMNNLTVLTVLAISGWVIAIWCWIEWGWALKRNQEIIRLLKDVHRQNYALWAELDKHNKINPGDAWKFKDQCMDKVNSLSQAMRYGATLRPRCEVDTFKLVQLEDGSRTIVSCAIGAAVEGIGYNPLDGLIGTDLAWYKLYKRFPAINSYGVNCPVCGEPTDGLRHAIFHLNDLHHLTREEIADWLEEKGL